jgi:biopolymer transport protein TolR
VEDLNEKLKRIMSNRSDREVYLKADKDIPYGTVVRVMSEIKLAGVEKLGMVTIPPAKEEKVTKK